MSTPQQPRPDVDGLTRGLQQSLRRRRFRRTRVILIIASLAIAALALVFWSMYQDRGPVAPLTVIALDTLVSCDQTAHARAVLVVPESAERVPRRSGQEVIFQTTAPGEGVREQKAVSGAGGYAEVPWPLSKGATTASFRARHVDVARRQGNASDAHVYCWPRASAVLLVEIEQLLVEPPPPTGRFHAPIVPVGPPGAGDALASLGPDVRILYLLASTESPVTMLRLRDWVASRFGAAPGLPPGPILSQLDFPEGGTAPQLSVALVRRHFSGPLAALVRRREAAAAYGDLDVPALWVGPQAPAGLAQVPSWPEVPDKVRHFLQK